jgi:hypothetical protein
MEDTGQEAPSKLPLEFKRKQARLPTTLTQIESHVSTLLRGSDCDRNLSLRIVTAILRLQKDCTQIMSQNLIDRSVFSTGAGGGGRGGNMDRKETRIPRTKFISIGICEFIRTERKNRKGVTARQILDFLARGGILNIAVDQETGVYEKRTSRRPYGMCSGFLQSEG